MFKSDQLQLYFFGFLVTIIAFFTYFFGYARPSALFWDENYHIASAYKYLNGVFFMEPHPPLGKMLIALGEKWFSDNEQFNTNDFLLTDYIKGEDLPSNFDFSGLRFFSSFLMWWGGLIFFLICYKIFKNSFYAFLLSFFYLFENSFIVHNRSAMLEGIQLFFVLLTIYLFLGLFSKKKLKIFSYIPISLLIGLALSVKFNSLILILLIGVLLLKDFVNNFKLKKIWLNCFDILVKFFLSFLIIVLVLSSLYILHINLAKKVLNDRYYHTSVEYKELVQKQEQAQWQFWWWGIREHLQFSQHYQKGVPKFDFCKEGENGSLPITWPFMNKTINYRWDKSNDLVSYVYLIGNPLIWFLVLLGFILATCLIISYFCFGLVIKKNQLKNFSLIIIFWLLYLSYLIAVSLPDRVLYLYHYFIPLIFGEILFFLIFKHCLNNKTKVFKINFIILLAGLIFATFIFYSPLTYHLPLSFEQFQQRQIFDFWHFNPVN